MPELEMATASVLQSESSSELHERRRLMRWSKMGREMPAGGKGIQYFTFGPWEFNVHKAAILASNHRKYKVKVCQPSREWIGPFISIDHEQVGRSHLSKPLIFATVIQDGQAQPLLIDGHHRALKALDRQQTVRTITLDLADTLRILKAPEHYLQEMRQDGQRLGLLPSAEAH
jgi:hypothetical protein